MYFKVIAKNFKVLLPFREESKRLCMYEILCVGSTVFLQGHIIINYSLCCIST